MNALPFKAFLALSGLVAISLGTMILFAPVAFYAGYGLDRAGQVTLLNELRSHGLSLIGIGTFVGTGAFTPRLTTIALAVSGFFYLSYGLSRLVSMAFDGWPVQGLVISGSVELAVGSLSLLIYLRHRGQSAFAPI